MPLPQQFCVKVLSVTIVSHIMEQKETWLFLASTPRIFVCETNCLILGPGSLPELQKRPAQTRGHRQQCGLPDTTPGAQAGRTFTPSGFFSKLLAAAKGE